MTLESLLLVIMLMWIGQWFFMLCAAVSGVCDLFRRSLSRFTVIAGSCALAIHLLFMFMHRSLYAPL